MPSCDFSRPGKKSCTCGRPVARTASHVGRIRETRRKTRTWRAGTVRRVRALPLLSRRNATHHKGEEGEDDEAAKLVCEEHRADEKHLSAGLWWADKDERNRETRETTFRQNNFLSLFCLSPLLPPLILPSPLHSCALQVRCCGSSTPPLEPLPERCLLLSSFSFPFNFTSSFCAPLLPVAASPTLNQGSGVAGVLAADAPAFDDAAAAIAAVDATQSVAQPIKEGRARRPFVCVFSRFAPSALLALDGAESGDAVRGPLLRLLKKRSGPLG